MTLRKIAVFHCEAFPGSAWCCAEGIVNTFRAMGYEVFDGGRPDWRVIPIEALADADLILASGLEWYHGVLTERYGQAWLDLPGVKAAWFAESAHRDDAEFDFAGMGRGFDLHYYPAIQDAEEFAGRWLPFGVDPAMFHPRAAQKLHDAAFLGTIYPKRAEYIARIPGGLNILPTVSDPDRTRGFERLAETYSSTRIFVNLPAYSRLLVTKVTEIMACGTLLITPAIDHASGVRNMAPFTHGKHLVYYDPNHPEDIGALIARFSQDRDEADRIAAAGKAEVLRAHRLEQRLAAIIADAEALRDS